MDIAGAARGAEMAAGRRPEAPGKSAGSVGQMARAAVDEARAAGAELPRNAQGKAASAVARGAEPASVFAALVSEPPGGETPPVPDGVSPSAEPEGAGEIQAPEAGVDAAEMALALLDEMEEPPQA